MKRIYTLFLLVFFINTTFSQTIPKEKVPSWVDEVPFENNNPIKPDGAFYYLLLDYQDNIKTQEQFAHYAIQVLNSEGIQEFSDISISFDPTFQELVFNHVSITRDGQRLDRLAQSTINVYQRETNLERSLYDGSLTAVINLSDVRKGDIIEYSYTIKGFNPINKGNYSTTLYQQYTLPVEKIYHKIVTDNQKPIQYKLLNGAEKPKIYEVNNLNSYVWENKAEDYLQYHNNVPYWLNLQKRISVSTFKNWGDVVNLALPLYQYDKLKLKIPEEFSRKFLDKEDNILKLIRFVQDDVRYLGFESGIGAYKPNPPKKVLEQRYGDCKDKSLLLVNLLQNIGVEAYPFLVNTDIRGTLKELLPSHNLFNHCVVYFKHKNESYVVDPTMTGQGGNLSNMSLPKYGSGLLVKSGISDLIKIDEHRIIPKIKVEETITTDSIGGSAVFLIKSTYSGSRADQMRDYFNSNTQEAINNEFVNYYSGLYPSITSTQPVSFSDSYRNGKNEIVIEEYYNIGAFWEKNEELGLYVCQTEPMVLEGLIEYANSPKRNMPYYVGEPYEFEQKTTIALPEPWNAKDVNVSIDKESFSYNRKVRNIGRTVEVKHNYILKTNTLSANQVPEFLTQHEKIKNEIAYQLSHPGAGSSSSGSFLGFNWFSLMTTIVIVGLGFFFSKKVYKEYNPESKATPNSEEKSIGGWLALPGIGLVLSPIILIYQIVQNGYFLNGIWSAFYDGGYDNAGLLTFSMGFELIYNLAFLVFTILLIVLYFKKRTSLPKLIVIFYILNFAVPLLQHILLSPFLPEELVSDVENMETYKDLGKSLIGAAIWIPYFMVSTRVKQTFRHTYKSTREEIV